MTGFMRGGLSPEFFRPAHVRYQLARSAVPYSFDGNKFDNKPFHLSYLCYSSIAPRQLAWVRTLYPSPIDRAGTFFRGALFLVGRLAFQSAKCSRCSQAQRHFCARTEPSHCRFRATHRLWKIASIFQRLSPLRRCERMATWQLAAALVNILQLQEDL
jgi:hypothetical protein